MAFRGKINKEIILQRLVGLWPAILSAVLFVLALPMTAISPLIFVFLVPVLIALTKEDMTTKRAFWLFWWTGFLANIGKQYWLVYTMNHYGYIPLPLAVIVLVLMNGVLGWFWGCVGAGVFVIRKKLALPLIALIPTAWIIQEWALTWLFSGFPWELVGNALVNHLLVLAQFGDIFGVFGLSFWVMTGNVAVFEVYRYFKTKPDRFPVAPVAVFLGLFVIILGYGLWRMPNIESKLAQGKTIKVGILQGNIDQLVKWKSDYKKQTFETYRNLAKKTAEQGAKLIIMPETALPYWQKASRPLSQKLKKFAIENNAYTLVGYPYKIKKPNPKDERIYNKHNVATLIGPDGTAVGTAMKHKLVPFGEFLPFPDQIIWLKNNLGLKKARLTAGFTPGEDFNSIEYPPAGRFGVVICYETIFPALVRKIANLDTNFLVTITNDSWFGDTSAPHQHVDQVAMRAIEMRRSFARAANTGISCVVDATGRVRNQTGTYVRASIVDEIQTLNIRSVYAVIGDAFIYLLIGLWAVAAVIAIRKKD